jgi:hypothetical protein
MSVSEFEVEQRPVVRPGARGKTGNRDLDTARWWCLHLAMRCRLGATAFRLLIEMLRAVDPAAWRVNRVLIAWPSRGDIEINTGLADGSITKARQELIAAGLISPAPGHRRAGCDPTACYRIHRAVRSTAESRAAAKARRQEQHRRTAQKKLSEQKRELRLIGLPPGQQQQAA